MGTVSLPSSGTNSLPHPLDPLADRFPRTLCRIFPRSLQSTSHWEVPKACYSPSLTGQRGPGTPTFKSGVDASRAHRCHVIDGYHAFELEVPCLRACDYPSMAPVVGSRPACAQGTAKKSRPKVKKNRQSISEDQLDKNPKKNPRIQKKNVQKASKKRKRRWGEDPPPVG